MAPSRMVSEPDYISRADKRGTADSALNVLASRDGGGGWREGGT